MGAQRNVFMAEQSHLDHALEALRPLIEAEMRRVLTAASDATDLPDFYGQMAYHLGWVDEQLQPATLPPGKFLRPALVLWGCELAAASQGADAATRDHKRDQALPVAAAVELLHNFSLIHDDIEDHDELRRHRRTIWSIWGEAQGINTGDGMFCVMRLALWETLARGVPADIAVRLAQILDRTSLTLCEGQHLDMTFEAQATVTLDRYLDMIRRKTAALMRASAQLGALVGAAEDPERVVYLAEFGESLGMAFQVRDDILGIWAARDALGKAAAGDLRRKKMSLPIIRALASAPAASRKRLRAIYARPGPASEEEIAALLDILDRSRTRAWCQDQLAGHCATARAALERACAGAEPTLSAEPAAALGAVLAFVSQATHG